MAGLWQRITEWIDDQTLTDEDLNNEFDNIQQNSVAAEIEGYSTINNVPNDERMDSQVAPYPLQVRSYASSTAGELERLRYMLASVTGNTEWYVAPAASIAELASSLSSLGGIPKNAILSGAVNSGSGADALVPTGGSSLSVQLKATATPLVYVIDGVTYTATADSTLSGLSAAPAVNNTATISGAQSSTQGEGDSFIAVSAMGSNISGIGAGLGAFKYTNSTTEYFISRIYSSSFMFHAYRGFFVDSTNTPTPRVALLDAGTITLLKLSYVFINTVGGLQVTYNAPTYSGTAPSAPSIGDYWYDKANEKWKKYDGSAWNAANATLLGYCAQDASGCVAARTLEYYSIYSATNSIAFNNTISTEAAGVSAIIHGDIEGEQISVSGVRVNFIAGLPSWTVSGSSGTYYAYVDIHGNQVVSSISPYDRQQDLLGFYHPYYNYRCVASLTFDGSFITGVTTMPVTGTEMIGLGMTAPGAAGIYNALTRTTDSASAGRGGVLFTSSCGAFTTSSATNVDVTNLSGGLNISGLKPVRVELVPGPGADSFVQQQRGAANITNTGNVYLKVDSGTAYLLGQLGTYQNSAAQLICNASVGMFATTIAGLSAGSHTFKIQASVANAATTLSLQNVCLVVREV